MGLLFVKRKENCLDFPNFLTAAYWDVRKGRKTGKITILLGFKHGADTVGGENFQ